MIYYYLFVGGLFVCLFVGGVQLRDDTNPSKFIFYEAYVSDEAITIHKAQPHFEPWSKFKATGGVLNQSVVKSKGVFFTF